MEKMVVIYASNHGTTGKVAVMLSDLLGRKGFSVDVVNITEAKQLDLNQYNTVLLGGSIHAGTLQRSLKTFMNKNLLSLMNKRVGLFLCCMHEAEAQNEFDRAFPALIRQHAISKKIVGGEFLLEQMNFLEKMIVRKITGINHSVSKLYNEKIEQMVEEIINSRS